MYLESFIASKHSDLLKNVGNDFRESLTRRVTVKAKLKRTALAAVISTKTKLLLGVSLDNQSTQTERYTYFACNMKNHTP